MSRYDRPTEPQPQPEPVTPTRRRIPEWTKTIEDQRPTEEHRRLGREGVKGARAALAAAHRPVNASSLVVGNEAKK